MSLPHSLRDRVWAYPVLCKTERDSSPHALCDREWITPFFVTQRVTYPILCENELTLFFVRQSVTHPILYERELTPFFVTHRVTYPVLGHTCLLADRTVTYWPGVALFTNALTTDAFTVVRTCQSQTVISRLAPVKVNDHIKMQCRFPTHVVFRTALSLIFFSFIYYLHLKRTWSFSPKKKNLIEMLKFRLHLLSKMWSVNPEISFIKHYTQYQSFSVVLVVSGQD